MLRLVLLVLYLLASSQEKQGGSLDPIGLNTPPQDGSTSPHPPSDDTDQGGSLDPLG